MLAVQVRHGSAGHAEAYERIRQRFNVGPTGEDLIVVDLPRRLYDHGQLRIDLEVGIQRLQCRDQRFRGDFME
ncbi:hypothetical protein LJJ44_23805 [Pseudomonas sp. B24_DOA]|nr:hypothetical protein LJJ44_23805 [Pseudomonas sp. B24_DOA]WKV89603.1 hypothetical protein LJU32_04270 [Pseudomonas sp. B21_DOA]